MHLLSYSFCKCNSANSSWLRDEYLLEIRIQKLRDLCRFATTRLPANNCYCIFCDCLHYNIPICLNRQNILTVDLRFYFGDHYLQQPIATRFFCLFGLFQSNKFNNFLIQIHSYNNRKMKKNISYEISSPKFGLYSSSKNGSSSENYIRGNATQQPLQSSEYTKNNFQTHLENKFQQDMHNIKQQQNHENWEQKLSLILSSVSNPTSPKPQITPQRIFNLQNKITQQQKITLMQDLSKVLDNKNLFEHYLLKNEREKDSKDINSQIYKKDNINLDKIPKSQKSSTVAPIAPSIVKEQYVPLNVSAPVLKKNQQLHLKLKEMQIQEEIFGQTLQGGPDQQKSKSIIEQIIKVRTMNSNLKDQISQKLKNQPHENANRNSRFVTFLPQDRQKHFAAKGSSSQHQELEEKYNKLVTLNKEPYFRMTVQQSQYLQSLRVQNRKLIQQVEEMLKSKKTVGSGRLAELRRQVQQNEREKQTFSRELQTFKQTMRKVKQQNERLKSLLGR